jgi:transposase
LPCLIVPHGAGDLQPPALGHTLLVIVYHVLGRGVEYRELGAGYLDGLASDRLTQQLVRRLEKLGHKVTLEPSAVA